MTHPSEILDRIQRHELGGIVRGALESGKFSGRYFHAIPEFSPEDISSAGFDQEVAWRSAAFESLRTPGVSRVALALRYLMEFDATHSIVLGGNSIEQYREAVAAVTLRPLDGGLRESLREMGEALTIRRTCKNLSQRIRGWLQPLTKV